MRPWLAVPTAPIVTATSIVFAIDATTAEATTSTASTVVEPSASAVQVVAPVEASFRLEFCVSSFIVVSAPRIQLTILPCMSSVDGALFGTRSLGAGSLIYVLFVFLVANFVVCLLLTLGTFPVGFHLGISHPFLDLPQGAFLDVMSLFEASSPAFSKGVEEDVPYILPG